MTKNLISLTEEAAVQYYIRISDALTKPECLTDGEQTFLAQREGDIVRKHLTITKKQLDWLDSILEKHSELENRDQGKPSSGHDYFIRKSWAINKPRRRK